MPKKKQDEITVTCSNFNQDINDQIIAELAAPRLCEWIIAQKKKQRKEASRESTQLANQAV